MTFHALVLSLCSINFPIKEKPAKTDTMILWVNEENILSEKIITKSNETSKPLQESNETLHWQ